MKYWTIKKQIILGLSILILINIVTGIFTCMGIAKLKSFMENISTSQLRSVYAIGQIQTAESETYDLMLHHILAETQDETESYNSRLTDMDNKTDQMIVAFQQTA